MSVESVVRALWVPGLVAADKLLLIGIANHDGDGGAWPSIPTLSGYLCMSERATQRHLANLVLQGLVTVEHNAGGNDRTRADRRPNRYHLHLPAVDKPSDGVTDKSPRAADGVTKPRPRGDRSGVHGVTELCHPNHPLEPSNRNAHESAAPVDNPRLCIGCRTVLDETRALKTRCVPCQNEIDELRARRIANEQEPTA